MQVNQTGGDEQQEHGADLQDTTGAGGDSGASEAVKIVEGGITDVTATVPLGGSSDVGGTGDAAASADIRASTGAAGLDTSATNVAESNLLGGDIIGRSGNATSGNATSCDATNQSES